jgi:hypothetical protein
MTSPVNVDSLPILMITDHICSLHRTRRFRHAQTKVLCQGCTSATPKQYIDQSRCPILDLGLDSRMETITTDCSRLHALHSTWCVHCACRKRCGCSSVLGIVCWLYMHILFSAHMFPGTGGANSPKQRFEDVINSIQWPSHITRLPKNVSPYRYSIYMLGLTYSLSWERISPSRKPMNGDACSLSRLSSCGLRGKV